MQKKLITQAINTHQLHRTPQSQQTSPNHTNQRSRHHTQLRPKLQRTQMRINNTTQPQLTPSPTKYTTNQQHKKLQAHLTHTPQHQPTNNTATLPSSLLHTYLTKQLLNQLLHMPINQSPHHQHMYTRSNSKQPSTQRQQPLPPNSPHPQQRQQTSNTLYHLPQPKTSNQHTTRTAQSTLAPKNHGTHNAPIQSQNQVPHQSQTTLTPQGPYNEDSQESQVTEGSQEPQPQHIPSHRCTGSQGAKSARPYRNP